MSDGTAQSALFVTVPQVMVDAHSLRFTYANFYNDAGTGLGSYELPNPSDITIYGMVYDAASIRTPIIPGGAVLRPGEVRSWDVPIEVGRG